MYSPNTLVALPPKDEQKTIAAFLSAKCAEIDALTADIQTQINTLEQYKRSVITETVTKGLNPNSEMKKSILEQLEGAGLETPSSLTPEEEDLFSKFIEALQADETIY